MKNVVKRNGSIVPFDPQKIENAIAKAFMATEELGARDVSTMARAVELVVESNLRDTKTKTPAVEEIQNEVENALVKFNFPKTAKAYILYRKQHENIREIGRASCRERV